ncbi:hypothetical protein PMZ80_001666 [Knufia obscura]|uniref:Large ribosomal subunit protein mL67 n=1 Tax=Knufia obscura TaxID=1635080 RepID=A0ABR0S3T9_9EURO|nr:hypothetical protein PMZ80_001666 [Knufia obscura]
MNNTKIMKQMLFHGKKTVPEALRRDVWRPHFSLHFPQTPAGASKGLRVYNELRELAFKRQLDPPRELRIATQTDVENALTALGPMAQEKLDSLSQARGSHKRKFVMPVPGKRLPQFVVARRLMNQKATSVADVAATLTRMSEASKLTPQQALAISKEQKKERELLLSGKALKRLADIRVREVAKAAELEKREEYATARPGLPKIEKHALSRISLEFDGAVDLVRGGVTGADLLDSKDEATEGETGAQRALDEALLMMQAEKEDKINAITDQVSAQVEERLARMTHAEREQAEKAHVIARGLKREEMDARIRQVAEELKQEREQMQRKYPTPTREQQAQLHKQKNLAAAKIAATKKAEEQRVTWGGLYAEIGPAVDQAFTKIDEAWSSRLAQLQEDVETEKVRHGDTANHDVEIRWADIRDGTYAREWPDSVIHAEIQPKAVIKTAGTTVRQHFHLDEDEQPIPEQRSQVPRTQASTVHVFGSDVPDDVDNTNKTRPAVGRYLPPEQRVGISAEKRKQRIAEWAQTEVPMLRDRIVAMRQQAAILRAYFEHLPLDTNLQSTGHCMTAVEYARADLTRMVQDGQNEEDLKHAAGQLAYINQEFQYAESEVDMASQSPDADRARLDWIKLQAELIDIETKNFAAFMEANAREEFLAKGSERQALLEQYNRSQDEYEQVVASRNLDKFDGEFPFFAEVEERSENHKAAKALEEQILELEARSDKRAEDGDEEVREQLRALRRQYDVAQKKIQKDREQLHIGGAAWIEFKRRGNTPGGRARRSAHGSRSQEPVIEEFKEVEEDMAEEPAQKTGAWGRVKSMFGRK